MRVVVVGLGSMGKRRIRLIKQIDESIEIFGVDARMDRRNEAEEKFGIASFENLGEALNMQCDCAFICTSPLSHADIIEKCLQAEVNVFTEINLVCDKYDSNIALANKNGCVLFLSSTFLYRDEIRYIREKVRQSNSILSYTYHVGQYLPDWHPWESYKDYFIGDSRTSGCREIMAIDLPWIYKTFGPIKSVRHLCEKKTELNTTYPDGYLLLIEHENGTQGTMAVDVISRKAVRNFEVFAEDLYLTWDGTVTGLKEYNIDTKTEETIKLYDNVDTLDGYANFTVENAYKNEVEAFFNIINSNSTVDYGFEEDKVILSIIDDIEK